MYIINKKDFCRKRAKQSLNPSAWEKFRTLRRQVKSLLHDKRKEFFQNLPDLLKTSSKKFWSVFKSVSKHSNIPNKVSWSKDLTTHIAADNPADIANVFNRYFFSVFNTAQCHDSHRHLDQENYNTIDTLPDIVITPEEVYECLCTLDQNKASGHDRIPANGNCPTLRQSQRAGLLAMLPITDLFHFYHFYHMYPRYLRDVSTTGLLSTLEKNYIICSLVS